METTDKKEHLLNMAESLFAENGFDATSTRVIAEKSGMNVAMISYYFGSKEKLFEELIIRKTSYMRNQLTALIKNTTMSPWEKMEVLIDTYVERIISNQSAFHRIMMRELSLRQRSSITKTIEERITYNMKAVHGIILDGIRKKVFRKEIDFSLLMSTMIGTITHVSTYETLFCRFLRIEGASSKVNPDKQKERLKNHLKELFAAYLLVQPHSTKPGIKKNKR